MTLEKEIEYLLNNLAWTVNERWECLNELYCVVGTNYDWKDGEIVPDEYKIVSEERKQKDIQDYFYTQELKKKFNKYEPYPFYPISEDYSNLFNIPKGVKQDWLEGAIETIDFILTHCKSNQNVYSTVSKETLVNHKQSLIDLLKSKKDLI